MKNYTESISLNARLNPVFTALVTSFAEQSAKAFGLDHAGALKLTLACEEIFTYLCGIDKGDKPVTIEAINGLYFVQVKILFDVAHFDPRAFNLTAKVSLDDESGLEDMGLLIASRSVDRFSINHDAREGTGVVLIKDKSYPEISRTELTVVKPLKNITIISPDPEALKLFVHQTVSMYPNNPYPPDFRFPGKLVDMVASGEYKVLIATDNYGTVGGGVIWRWRIARKKIVECAGPYIFGQPPESGTAEKLMDALIGAIAKTEAICLVNEYATPELPGQYFEPLGLVDYYGPDGTFLPWCLYYRLLKEDVGSRVWAHPELQDFLKTQYKLLSFARKIELTGYGGEARPPHSVFASQFIRAQRVVILRPVWDGIDVSVNLSKHLQILKNEGIQTIFVEIDLGHAWQANLAPALRENGFTPRLILPYAGKADIVVFQYREGV